MPQILRITKPDPDKVRPVDILEKAVSLLVVSLMKETLEKPKAELSLVVRFDLQTKVIQIKRSQGESPELFVSLTTGEVEDAQPAPLRTSDYDFNHARKHAIAEIRDTYLQFRDQLENSLYSSSLEFPFKRGMLQAARSRFDRKVPLPQGLDRGSTL